MTATVKSWIEERRTIHRDGWTGKWSWSLNNRDLATLRATGGHVDFDLIRDDVFRGSSEVLDEIIDAHNVTVPRALNALEQVLEIHRPVQQVFSWQAGGTTSYDPCETCHGKAGKPGDYECGCWSDRDLVYTCAECRGDKGRDIDWPCPTVQAIEGAISDER